MYSMIIPFVSKKESPVFDILNVCGGEDASGPASSRCAFVSIIRARRGGTKL
jgi:hypothetical protein